MGNEGKYGECGKYEEGMLDKSLKIEIWIDIYFKHEY